MIDSAALKAIGVYQRYLSPYKGFCCAYRVHSGRASCSEYARRIVRRIGALALLQALPRQFARCRSAFAALRSRSEQQRAERRERRREAGRDCIENACEECGNSACDVGACDCSP
ncbi:membrane protein insertion efficiency factor YidD [Aquincola sp. S2]|uniref:Membrane protein insertion efficiency factor YidD n=1 Tax=Pseudaquabacterium terrae TaxID=2732868 RepID=A0ABX2EJI8_9BURK|nr:membrane protein insertion efficiency factor YidD [Aquabacterium terrae]NRF68774.1 membrane protein insertion efficiency factor YidD [Aquabacterium terrae]